MKTNPTYEIKREASLDNINMKWHLVTIAKTGCKFSDWYRTKREAVTARDRSKRIYGRYTTTV